MAAEEVNSISSFDSQTPPMMFHGSTSFTIQHSENMHKIAADLKMYKRRKQTALPRKKIYIEREKLRRMEISAPMPSSAFQEPRLHQTNEMEVKTNSGYEMRKSLRQECYANKAELRSKQVISGKVQQQGTPLAVRVFEYCVLPELKAKLPQPKSTMDNVLGFELQPSAAGAHCSYASIYEIPPAAQTWLRSDCLKDRDGEGLFNEIM